MKIYQEDDQTIFLSQFRDPLMDHLYQKILFHLRQSPGKKILDIGCGVGKVAFLATKQGLAVTGVEIENKVAKLAKKNLEKFCLKGKSKIIAGDFLRLKLKKNYFDAIVCSEVIEHVVNPQKIINKARQLLKKNGLLILTIPHRQKFWTVTDEYAQHKKRFEIAEVKKILSDFQIINLYTIGFPGMLTLVMLYNSMIRFFNLRHDASWRQQNIRSFFYYHLATLLLKLDDFFNSLKLGLVIIAVAKKNEAVQ